MRWRMTWLAVAGLSIPLLAGCGDAPGNKSFSCHWSCPASESSGSKNYSAADADAAQRACQSDTSIDCVDALCGPCS